MICTLSFTQVKKMRTASRSTLPNRLLRQQKRLTAEYRMTTVPLMSLTKPRLLRAKRMRVKKHLLRKHLPITV